MTLIQETIIVDKKYKIGLAVKKKGKKTRERNIKYFLVSVVEN